MVSCAAPHTPAKIGREQRGDTLGAYLRYLNSECICAAGRFLHSTDKFYQQAGYFYDIGLPFQGESAEDNEAFINTMDMLADYGSGEGSIVGRWPATIYGHETGECSDSDQIITGSVEIVSHANTEAGMTTE